MAKGWQNRHISTKWGVGILLILLLGLIIAIPQLSTNQSLFGRAYDGGIDCNSICKLSKNDVCSPYPQEKECKEFNSSQCVQLCNEENRNPAPVDPNINARGNSDDLIGKKCKTTFECKSESLQCKNGYCLPASPGYSGSTGNGDDKWTSQISLIKNVDYKITAHGGTLTKQNGQPLERWGNDYTYRWKHRTANGVITLRKSNRNVTVDEPRELVYSTRDYSCGRISQISSICRYNAQVSIENSANRCAIGVDGVGETGGFLRESYCPAGNNYKCCATSVTNTKGCIALGEEAYCEVVKESKKNNPQSGSYSEEPVCSGPNSVKCWVPRLEG